MPHDQESIYSSVYEDYTKAVASPISTTNTKSQEPSSNPCQDPSYVARVAAAFGYSPQELSHVPEGANLGLSCGNPHVLANLKQGETVLDLGCGAGFDVFLAAKQVGKDGKAIGVDMNESMLDKANELQSHHSANNNHINNTTFLRSQITNMRSALPESEIADCIISNCVINLVPHESKHLVFQEMFRLLRPGGRVAISDILTKNDVEMPSKVKNDMALYVGCIAGASKVQEYDGWLRAAGFKDIVITNTNSDLNVYHAETEKNQSCVGCGPGKQCGPENVGMESSTSNEGEIPGGIEDFNLYAGSYKVYAVK